jgi:hypothetical protein
MNEKKNDFGVVIRSVGERTEGLCFDACKQAVDEKDIVIIRGVFPASKAYQQMFTTALSRKWRWFLGVDADVVMTSDWLEIAKRRREDFSSREWLVFGLGMEDKWLGRVDRGNHFYNGRHVQEALRTLQTKTAGRLKPESDICRVLKYYNPFFKDEMAGYHGYEQYYRDIFYTFWLRAKRNPLAARNMARKMDTTDLDDAVAKKGLEAGRPDILRLLWYKLLSPRNGFVSVRPEERGGMMAQYFPLLREKEPLTLNRSDFYDSV